jgi:2',3'-cyclic-nucleotide 2'-phosphodiesterase / 3'-nucleotidase / 5'-nucleotidase
MQAARRLLLSCCLLASLPAWSAAGAEFAPVYQAAPDGGLQAQVVGRYDGGRYQESAASTPPAYAPARRWLYVVSLARLAVEALDITDPTRPRLAKRIGYEDFARALLGNPLGGSGLGGLRGASADGLAAAGPRLIGEIRSVAYAQGVLAVAFGALQENERGRVLFLDSDGDPSGDPVSVGVDPDAMAFTPDGGTLVVANTATAAPGDDPEGSVSVVTVRRHAEDRVTTDVKQVDFRGFDGQAGRLRAEGVRLFGPNASVAQDLEPESVAIAPDGATAYVSAGRNNAIVTVDLRLGLATAVHGLGTRDLAPPGQGIDASDRDGRIDIRPWPVHGYFEPDGIGVYPAGDTLYLVTANEGDPRDYEDARVAELPLDPGAFVGAAELQREENLGRLRVTRVEGDSDGDGDYDRLFTLGTRSFAVWTTTGQLIADSGDEFERVTAAAVPAFFNTPDDANLFDGRSADRGPEPEPLAVGQVGERWYSFVGFERIGGVIAHDVSEPAAPRFAFYLNNRNFAVDPAQVCRGNEAKSAACAAVGDLEPEALLFIPAERSPNGSPLLVVTHEQTDSVILLQLGAGAGG